MSEGPLLSIRDLHVKFALHRGFIHALKGISFDIPRAKTVALVGESGSGKSVTAQAVMGILPDIARVTNGEIIFNADGKTDGEIDIASLPQNGHAMRDIRGGQIAMIFQEPMVSLSPLHTIGDQVSEALFLHRDISKAEGMELTEAMLAKVGFPDPKRALSTYPFELSGGLRQRAMIAMALVCRPRLLIADEPTTALDVTVQAQILHLIKSLQQELDMAVLIITHDLGVVANVADEVVVAYHGEIMEKGSVEHIYRDPQHPYLDALLKAVPHFDMKSGERLVPVRDIEFELGPMFQADDNPPATNTQEIILRVKNLTRSFSVRKQQWFSSAEADVIKAVNDVSFEVERGTCFGLVGESGCGKTTLSKLLMRAITPDTGGIHFYDEDGETDILQLSEEQLTAFRRKMQFIFQDPFSSLNPRMTVFDILREPLAIHGQNDRAHQVEMAQELMRLVGLDARFLNRYPHSFSGGQRQRVGIARALALKPKLIICDEPVSALDVSIQAQILNLLKDLQKELNLTYIFISHNLAVVDYMADRIAVMCGGRLVEMAPRERIFNQSVHPYTQKLLAAVPFADLDRPVEMESFSDSGATDPGAWHEPFGIAPNEPGEMLVVDTNHWVRAKSGTTVPELAA